MSTTTTTMSESPLCSRVFKLAHQLRNATDTTLFEKVKLALQQLNM